MLVNVTLVPDTALLVPGASGATPVLVDVRSAAVDAARALLADHPCRVVVVAAGPRDRVRPGPFAPTLAAAGIHDDALGWRPPPAGRGPSPTVVAVPTSATALLLLAHAGWTGPVTLVEVVAPGPPAWTRAPGRAGELTALGRTLTAGPDRVALLVAGSASARGGPDAPLAPDPRAHAADAAMVADLGDGDPAARGRLGAVDPHLAAELAVTAWAPLRVALGAVPADAGVRARRPRTSAPWGLTYVVACWRPA